MSRGCAMPWTTRPRAMRKGGMPGPPPLRRARSGHGAATGTAASIPFTATSSPPSSAPTPSRSCDALTPGKPSCLRQAQVPVAAAAEIPRRAASRASASPVCLSRRPRRAFPAGWRHLPTAHLLQNLHKEPGGGHQRLRAEKLRSGGRERAEGAGSSPPEVRRGCQHGMQRGFPTAACCAWNDRGAPRPRRLAE